MASATAEVMRLRDGWRKANDGRLEALALLKDVEWVSIGGTTFCSLCRASKDNGHMSRCRLAAALK